MAGTGSVPGNNGELVGQRLQLISPGADAVAHEAVQQQEWWSVALPLERDAELADLHSVHTVNHPTTPCECGPDEAMGRRVTHYEIVQWVMVGNGGRWMRWAACRLVMLRLVAMWCSGTGTRHHQDGCSTRRPPGPKFQRNRCRRDLTGGPRGLGRRKLASTAGTRSRAFLWGGVLPSPGPSPVSSGG